MIFSEFSRALMRNKFPSVSHFLHHRIKEVSRRSSQRELNSINVFKRLFSMLEYCFFDLSAVKMEWRRANVDNKRKSGKKEILSHNSAKFNFHDSFSPLQSSINLTLTVLRAVTMAYCALPPESRAIGPSDDPETTIFVVNRKKRSSQGQQLKGSEKKEISFCWMSSLCQPIRFNYGTGTTAEATRTRTGAN